MRHSACFEVNNLETYKMVWIHLCICFFFNLCTIKEENYFKITVFVAINVHSFHRFGFRCLQRHNFSQTTTLISGVYTCKERSQRRKPNQEITETGNDACNWYIQMMRTDFSFTRLKCFLKLFSDKSVSCHVTTLFAGPFFPGS